VASEFDADAPQENEFKIGLRVDFIINGRFRSFSKKAQKKFHFIIIAESINLSRKTQCKTINIVNILTYCGKENTTAVERGTI
jgi:hypothetical protein